MIIRLLFCLIWIHAQGAMTALYLSWYGDPTTTMAIHWHSQEYETSDTLYLQSKDSTWHAIVGTHEPLHYLLVHTVHLAQLQPDTEYLFRIGEDPTVHKFKTAPSQLEKPFQFIIGGDADYDTKLFTQMNRAILKKNPLFCVIGGDIAYAIRRYPLQLASSAFNRWIAFLMAWKNQMVTEDGRLIPFLLVAGNHDISKEYADLFFTLFPIPNKILYRSLDFSNYLSLLFLDTGHLSPIEGAQTTWLESALAATQQIPFRLAVYHEGAYPSFYPYEGMIPTKVRTFWCPLFDKYHLTAAFEHHNHTFKRTHPLTNNEIDPAGIVYFGDGCWGVPPRKPNELWYLAKQAAKNHVYLVQMNGTETVVQAIDLEGKVFDSTTFHLPITRN